MRFYEGDDRGVGIGCSIKHGRGRCGLQLLYSFCKSQGIAFGVIFTNNDTSPTQELSGQDYYNNTMLWIQTVKGAIGFPQDSIFQSWIVNGDGIADLPINLPENDPSIYSHTRLINDGLAVLSH